MKKLYCLILAAAVIAGCKKDENPSVNQTPDPAQAEASLESCLIEGEMIVEFTEEMTQMVEADLAKGAFLQTKSAGINEIFSELGVTSVERVFPYDEEWEPRHRAFGLHRWYVLKYTEDIPHTKAAVGLEGIEGINFVEMPHKIKSTATFNDPKFKDQWHYYNDGSLGSTYRSGCDVNCVPVWQNYTGGSSDVIVGVVDGGIDLTHEDLAAVCIAGGKNGSKNFVDGSYTIVAHNHGTHVAGTIGAINNNGKGVCGIAGGTDGKGGVRLLSCQIFQTDPSTGKDKSGSGASAIVWACDKGAVICQNSWGYTYDTAEQAAAGSAGAAKAAIDYFRANAGFDANGNQVGPMAGGVVIFAAGNDAWADGWPAEYAPVIAVGAVNGAYKRSYYSNYGDWVDICAPGGDSKSGHLIHSTLPSNKYGTMQGTSMACPHVSGVAALIVSHFGGPGFTNAMLESKLINGAKTGVVSANSQIGNLVDAMGAFSSGGNTPPDKVSTFTVSAISNNLAFSAVLPADTDDKQAYGLVFLASKNKADLTSLNMSNLPSSVKSLVVPANGAKAGTVIEDYLKDLEFETDYYAAVVAYDYGKNYSAVSDIKSVKTQKNNPPTVTTEYTGDYRVKSHQTLVVNYTIADPDLHKITIDFKGGSTAATSVSLGNDVYQLTIVGNVADPGKYTASYTVTDSYGAQTVYNIEYTILENQAPVIVKTIDNIIFEVPGEKTSLDMTKYIIDPDEEPLKYTVSISDRLVLHINPKEEVLFVTALDYGLVDVTVTGTDSRGLTCSQTFKVLVRDPEAPADIYPNPVSKNADGISMLYVSGGSVQDTYVKVTSASGTVVYEGTTEAGAFSPVAINMDKCAAGKYKVVTVIDGHTTTKSIVKL